MLANFYFLSVPFYYKQIGQDISRQNITNFLIDNWREYKYLPQSEKGEQSYPLNYSLQYTLKHINRNSKNEFMEARILIKQYYNFLIKSNYKADDLYYIQNALLILLYSYENFLDVAEHFYNAAFYGKKIILKNVVMEINETINMLKDLKKSRVMPIRGANTARGRGAVVMFLPRRDIQLKILPQMQNVFTKRIVNFDLPYGTHVTAESVFLSSFLSEKVSKDVFLFDVELNNDHVLAGILMPEIAPLNRKLFFINTYPFKKEIIHNIVNSLTDGGYRGAVYFLPNFLPQTDADGIDKHYNLQRSDDKCRGNGQCQFWTFMVQYIFLREYSKYLNQVIYGSLVNTKHTFFAFLQHVWTILETFDKQELYNNLQREMHLLGGRIF